MFNRKRNDEKYLSYVSYIKVLFYFAIVKTAVCTKFILMMTELPDNNFSSNNGKSRDCQKYKWLFDNSVDAVFVMKDGVFVECNPRTLQLFNCREEEILNTSPVLFSPEFQPSGEKSSDKAARMIDTALKKGEYTFEWLHKKFSGELFDAKVSLKTLTFDNEILLMAVVRDNTETKSSHEKIRLLAHALESITQAVSVTDIHNKILFVNNVFLRMYGYENEDLAGWKIEDVRSERNPTELGETIRTATLAGGWEGKIWNKRKNGKEFLAYLSTSIVKDDKGSTIALMGIVTDITEKKKWEEQVNLLTTALEAAANGIVITNDEGDIIWNNQSFTTLTGYSSYEIYGHNVRILKSGKMNKKYYSDLWNIVKSGKVWHGEIINKKKNGELYTEEMTITPVRIDGDEITHYIALKQDITERKKYELELKETKEAAEAANKLKATFLANMSHELRTPMVGILGYADILNHELQDTGYKDMAANLYESGNRLMETLNHILHLSKLEANKLEMEAEVVNVDAVIQTVINKFGKMAKRRNLYLNYSPAEQVHCFLETKMLNDVLNNLVNNALKFTNSGGVTIELKASGNLALIKVIDTGIGISREVQDFIFEEFRQASEGINRRFEGTGLGLTISKKFVELMDGKISVESEEGTGSTFTVELPLYIENERIYEIGNLEHASLETEHKTIKKVLLVENDRASREITQLFLKRICTLDFADNAETAIHLAEENIYDAILMDINLDRGVSGLDVTRSIKKIKGYENTPIIAITAYAIEEDQKTFLAAGCSDYLSKPFDRKTITHMLMQILEKNQK